jgi:DNA-binding CsgD family transcriptional regulator
MQAFSPLALQVRRVTSSVVGRPSEMAAIQQELESAGSQGISAITVEGEPGIGKTRLLLAASQLAASKGFTPVAVTADEELRGPFLVARGILAGAVTAAAASARETSDTLQRALEAVSGRPEPGLESLPADQQLLRAFDLGAMALAGLAAEQPLAVLVDDMQWADEDSLRLLRYLVRAYPAGHIFLMLALRPEEFAFVNEAVNLIADMERMGLIRRLKLHRFSQTETAEFLRHILGAKVDPSSAAAMHGQSEGVPFILEEVAQAYRDAGMIQEIDGVWTLARNAERLVPSAVRTLIQRRAARLPVETKEPLAEAALLGRRFSLRDLQAIRTRLDDGDGEGDVASLAEALAPAVAAGLLIMHPSGGPADYSFPHDQIRDFATSSLTTPRRRAIHTAIMEILTGGGEPPPESLALLTQHALAAGDTIRCARFSCQAARHALDSHAPEEVLRVVELGLPAASDPQDRITLLTARDGALEMLRRPGDRLEGLAELSALAEAMGDSHLELDVLLRRAAAVRLSDEFDQAASLARRVRELAVEQEDPSAELAACLELAQDLLRSPLGEGYVAPHLEVDVDGAEEALGRAVVLAERLGDQVSLAAATRELGVVAMGKVRREYVALMESGALANVVQELMAGQSREEILAPTAMEGYLVESQGFFERALELYEALGDRRGVMSSIIGMAYSTWGADVRFGSARRVEDIRRLATRMQSLTTESERAQANAQMLYGVQLYSRAKGTVDLALARGEEAYRAAKELGDRSLEFATAGTMALSHLDMGEMEEAERWLNLAAQAASAAPTPLRARRLESWRGMARSQAGDAAGMREHLERALRLATDQGRPAARCEALARLALECARLGVVASDEELLAVAEGSAREAKEVMSVLPGHPQWGAQADAALARVLLARGDEPGAVEAARSALASLDAAMHEDLYPDVVLPAADVLDAAGTDEDREAVRARLRVMAWMVAQRTLEEDVRVRWFRGPIGRELVRLAGSVDVQGPSEPAGGAEQTFTEEEMAFLRLLTEGRTNREIADELSLPEEQVVRKLGQIFAKMGASSRTEATLFTFAQGAV